MYINAMSLEYFKGVYAFWPFNCLICLVFLFFFYEFKNSSFFNVTIFSVCFFIITSILMIGAFFIKVDGRGSFIFGPNVLYRIFACGGIVLLLIFANSKTKVKILISSFVVLYFLLGIYVTDSRGDLVTLPFLLLACIHFIRDRLQLTEIILIGGLVLVFMSVVYMFLPEMLFSRFTNSTLEGSSRYTAWIYLIENFIEVVGRFEFSYLYFYNNLAVLPGFQYPHNIFLEFLYMYELIGLMFISFTMLFLFLKLKFFTTHQFDNVCFITISNGNDFYRNFVF
jgi:hypothetical protein